MAPKMGKKSQIDLVKSIEYLKYKQNKEKIQTQKEKQKKFQLEKENVESIDSTDVPDYWRNVEFVEFWWLH